MPLKIFKKILRLEVQLKGHRMPRRFWLTRHINWPMDTLYLTSRSYSRAELTFLLGRLGFPLSMNDKVRD